MSGVIQPTNGQTSEGVQVALNMILRIDPHDINRTFLQTMFAGHMDINTRKMVEPNFTPTSKIQLTPASYKFVKQPTETTLGLLILNRYLLEMNGIIQFLGYQNNPIDKNGLENLNREVNSLVLENKITVDQLVQYVDSRDRLGFWCSGFLSVSITPALLLPMENVNKRKNELFEKYKDDLNSDNPVKQVMANNAIEDELIGMVKENLKNDSGYDFYRSGDGNLGNNYKNINVMRGAVFDNGLKRYHIVKSSLMEGIKPNDITPSANSIVAAAYPSAIGTAEAGYMSKQMIALLQSEAIDPDPNSDCGTQSTIPILVTKSNKQFLIFRNIKEGNSIKGTDLHNIDSYIGKTINMYSPQCCLHKKICAKCAGKLFYLLGDGKVTNVGMLMSVITKQILDLKLKSKHDLSQKAGFMDVNKTFLNPNKYVEVTDDGHLKTKQLLKLFIPKYADDVNAYYIEATHMSCLGINKAQFLDSHGNVLLDTIMTIPTMVDLNIINDIQETMDDYVLTYEPDSLVCSLAFQQNIANVCQYLDLVFMNSKLPLMPYHLIADMTFRNLDLNKINLSGPSIIYETMARRLCRNGRDTYAFTYGRDSNINAMEYTKLGYREAVQQAGATQAMLFEDISQGININLANTINGVESDETPLEKIIRA